MAVLNVQAELNNSQVDSVEMAIYGIAEQTSVDFEVDVYSFLLREFSNSYPLDSSSIGIGFATISSHLNNCRMNSIFSSLFKAISYQDYLSSHARFFGVNFKQDVNKIYINKADLGLLTPKLNNTAESLFVALLLRVLNCESNSLISKVFIEFWRTIFYVENGKMLVENIYLFKIYQLLKYDSSGTLIVSDKSITPNDLNY